ncbi:MAG: hypothetical protein KFF73_18625 [Cyclobacteriaceae bacterium]|nr:hypothetical protein [Cyclobacteriaceae bacterium]
MGLYFDQYAGQGIDFEQAKYGEKSFDWDIHTDDIIQTAFKTLGTYVSKGEMKDILAQVPEELHPLFKEAT